MGNQSSTNQAFLIAKEGAERRAGTGLAGGHQTSKIHQFASLHPRRLHCSSWPATVTSEYYEDGATARDGLLVAGADARAGVGWQFYGSTFLRPHFNRSPFILIVPIVPIVNR
jgi:hypothetical protein